MEQLLLQTEELDKTIDGILPLLITDQWKESLEKILEMIPMLSDFLEMIVNQEALEVSLEVQKSILTRLIHAIKIEDSIQLADILAYEIGGLIQAVYQA